MRLLGKILVRSIDVMQAFTTNMGGLLLVFIVGLMTTAVLFRYVVQNPVYLAEGFLQLMMGWMVFLLMASVSRRDEHIRIGFFVNKVLGPRAKSFIFALENISSLALC
ncbi:TRAP transporter small permease, partial [Chloroflexota bacterium]